MCDNPIACGRGVSQQAVWGSFPNPKYSKHIEMFIHAGTVDIILDLKLIMGITLYTASYRYAYWLIGMYCKWQLVFSKMHAFYWDDIFGPVREIVADYSGVI
jgi:hypothetical protein